MKQERGSLSTFARLYMAELLPESAKRVLYLDCDLLVMDDISELAHMDMQGMLCAGVRDCISAARLRYDGLSAKNVYINAGVMLIDLELWRRERISAVFEKYSDSYGGNVQYADQGIVNGALKGRILALEPKYNCYTAMYDFSYSELMTFRKPPVYYSYEEIEKAKNEPCIVHFTTSFLSLRPWFSGCTHPCFGKWNEYRKKTPWAAEPERVCGKRTNSLGRLIFKVFPRKAAVAAAGFVHSIAVPFLKGVLRR